MDHEKLARMQNAVRIGMLFTTMLWAANRGACAFPSVCGICANNSQGEQLLSFPPNL